MTARRGRPPLDWLTPAELAAAELGASLVVDEGRGRRRVVGRLVAREGRELVLETRDGERRLDVGRVHRARRVPQVYEDGDPVLLRGVPAAAWRGGVVRSQGARVLVETASGREWRDEAELEAAEARPDDPPRLPPGPAPRLPLSMGV